MKQRHPFRIPNNALPKWREAFWIHAVFVFNHQTKNEKFPRQWYTGYTFGLFNCDQWLWCRTIFDLYWWNSLFEMRCRVYASLHVNPSWREFFLFAKQINITGLIFGGMFKVTGWVNFIVLPKAILWCTERCLFRFVRMCEVFTLVSVLNDVCQTISTFSQRCRHGDRLTTACLLADTKILACKMLQILKRNVCL